MSSKELLVASAEEEIITDTKQLFLFSARNSEVNQIPVILPLGASLQSTGYTAFNTSSYKFSPRSIYNSNWGNSGSQMSIQLGVSSSEILNWLLTNGPDCTVEGWVSKASAWNQYEQIFGNWESPDSASNGAFQFALVSGKIFAQFGGANIQGSTAAASNGTWNHVAWCRVNGQWHLYLNGVSNATAKSLTTITGIKSNVGFLKTHSNQIYGFSGSIDEFRIVIGKALYTTNFTPPTERFPAQRYI